MDMMKKTVLSTALLFSLSLLSAPLLAGGVVVAKSDKGKLKLSSKLFLGLLQKKSETNGVSGKESLGVSLDRAYFVAKYKFDDTWSMGFNSDATVDTTLKGKQTRLFVKKAYMKGSFSPEAQVSLGVIGTPWIGYEDKLFKHRYASKSYVDRKKFDSSADAGVALAGKLGGKTFSYNVALVNGAGYSKISASNAMDLNVRLGIYPLKGLTLDFNYRDGYMGKKTFAAVDPAKQTVLQALATYGNHSYRVGAEYVNHEHAATDAVTDIGLIVWGRAKWGAMGAFARFEQTDSDKGSTAVVQSETRSLLGAEYFIRKGVKMALVFDQSNTDNSGFTAGENKKKSHFGLVAQVNF